jgi:nucleotide-binding universal stress UspA family protein
LNKALCPVDFEHSLERSTSQSGWRSKTMRQCCVLNVAAIPMGAAELSSSGQTGPFWEVAARSQLQLIAKEKLTDKVTFELTTRSGDAAVGILQAGAAAGVDLSVMATHGRKGLSHFFIGSVAEQVVREAICPVLTIRPA